MVCLFPNAVDVDVSTLPLERRGVSLVFDAVLKVSSYDGYLLR